MVRFRLFCVAAPAARLGVVVIGGALALAVISISSAQSAGTAQQAAPAPAPGSQPATQPAPAEAPQATPPAEIPPAAPTAAPHAAPQPAPPGEITEDQLRRMLVGKPLFLRGGYLDNDLSFNEHGVLIGHSPQGSYTLSGIQIDRVRLTKQKVELEGSRYALHFLGALAYEDPTKAVDRVNITPKKKVVKITIDRELVVKPKQEKGKNKSGKPGKSPAPPAAPVAPSSPVASAAPATPASSATPAAAPGPTAEGSGASKAQAGIAAAPLAERPAGPKGVTTTTSPAHANKVLEDALDNVFAQGFDARMMAAMPGFWKLYYEAAAEKTDYRPKDPAVLSQNEVDKKARLVSIVDPVSNQFAQDNGVTGMCLYYVVVGADGKPGEIAVARPIGFGLDESAVDSIRKATFEPAVKDGKPVPVMLDLEVMFRIYSKQTAKASQPEAEKPAEPTLPGPYSVQH